MKPFEVTVSMPGPEPALQMLLNANHWMEAWRVAMGELGLEEFDDSQVTCKIREDGAVEVIMPQLEGRRFLVATAPSPEPTTTDRPAAPSRRPGITIEELKPVKPDDTVPELDATPSVGMAHVHLYPRVHPLDGGTETNVREAVNMLASHVPAEHVLYLIPGPERTSWSVVVGRGEADSTLDGTTLSSTAAVPGPVDTAAGRRRFAGDVVLTFTSPVGSPTLVVVGSALWAPVHVEGTCHGVFLALNTERPGGFDGGEFDAIQQLAALVSKRMETA